MLKSLKWVGVLVVAAIAWVPLAMASEADPNPGPQPAYKHRITIPGDGFQSWTAPSFIKFTILLKEGFDPNVVFFQDSTRYEFHFDFATEQLTPFLGMTQAEYDRVTLYASGQQAVLGAVIVPPPWGKSFNEYGIQFTRYDVYTREEISHWFSVVKAAITAGLEMRAYYFPTYEQFTVAQQNLDWFSSHAMPVGSTAQWATGNTVYADGWAVGVLRFVEAGQIQSSFARGDLVSSNILLTDATPAEVPPLAGIMTLAPASPNSHVAILSQSKGLPFIHLAVDTDAAKAKALTGRRVYLAAAGQRSGGGADLTLLDVNDVQPDLLEALADLKRAPAVEIRPIQAYGSLCADTEALTPADIPFFGGKASNYGVLRRAVPDASPKALAFSFDLWNAFLDEVVLGSTSSLRQQIRSGLAAYRNYPPSDMEGLTCELARIRALFTDAKATSFPAPLDRDITDSLLAFGLDPNRPIRFRSSTNVEDSDRFTGAGLYDSFSGCLADDLDADETGPCHCDPAEAKERGVFRAIRKVFASFYNDNAFLERLRTGVDESQVGMALLVHPSFPDEIELANGVATMKESRDGIWSVDLVCQLGAVSVTNPPLGAVPERVRMEKGVWGVTTWIEQRSSLVPLRQPAVMEWEADYLGLYDLLEKAANQYVAITGRADVTLDLEFKKTSPEGRLVLKQIRPIPQSSDKGYTSPLLLGGPRTCTLVQGRGGDVFANHRLKSRWTLRPQHLWLAPESLQACPYGTLDLEYVSGGKIHRISAPLSSLPGASHEFEPPQDEYSNFQLTDTWVLEDADNTRTYRLVTRPMFQATVSDPVVTPDDLGLRLEVEYANPVYSGHAEVTRLDVTTLYTPWEPTPVETPEEFTYSDANGLSITTRFYVRWAFTGRTPTSIQFVETQILGLTATPIVLKDLFSQSVGGGAHLCPKQFLFEPQLEPGLAPEILDELAAKDIRLVYLTTGDKQCRPTEVGDTDPYIRLYGFTDPVCQGW
jgi:hypothetical protein